MMLTKPAGLRSAIFKLADGVRFVHLEESEDGSDPLSEVPAYHLFRDGINQRRDEPPVVTDLYEIGSSRLLAG